MKICSFVFTLLLSISLLMTSGCGSQNSEFAENESSSTISEPTDDHQQPDPPTRNEIVGDKGQDQSRPVEAGVGNDTIGKDTTIASESIEEHNANEELPTLSEVENSPSVPENDPYVAERKPEQEKQTIDIPDSWKRLSQVHEIWVDVKNRQVIAAGNICMRAGPLEVFACPRRTKEHEAIVSVNALSSQIHAALLAIGAEPGEPVRWTEKYVPATGPVIKIDVIWKDKDDVKKIAAQEMVRDFKTGKTMTHDWVFGGSQTFTDEETGESYYYGDSGELVCLSNFSTATLDVPVESSDANEGLLFEAHTPNIPEVNTKVYLVFRPQLEKKTTAPSNEEGK